MTKVYILVGVSCSPDGDSVSNFGVFFSKETAEAKIKTLE